MKQTPNPKPLTKLSELKAMCDAPLACRFEIDGQLTEVPLRRLTPALEEQRREILREATSKAPYVKERGEYDMMNPEYLKAREAAERKARNLVAYACCPLISEQRPGLTNPTEISKFINELGLPDYLLDIIALTAAASGLNVEVARRANFISPPGSES